MSIGNFSSRKCVLKKWNVKMNPAASNASSECTTSAMLIIHPGMNRVKNTGYYITVRVIKTNDAMTSKDAIRVIYYPLPSTIPIKMYGPYFFHH